MGGRLALLVLLTMQWLLSASSVAAHHGKHLSHVHNAAGRTATDVAGTQVGSPQTGQKPLLRLMPLGASITQGWDVHIVQDLQNGYRKPLREKLRYRGYAVNMVGSRAEGDFSDRQHEGWPGMEINDVAVKMLPIMTTQKPNLVLILLGTNDCLQARRDKSMSYAKIMKDRMRTMIEKIYSLSLNVTIILATLPPTRDTGNEPYIQTVNAGFKQLAQELQGLGRKIELVDMYTNWLRPEDYSDTIHFKPLGYAKLAALFADGFSRVEAKGWLSVPADTSIPDNAGCYPSPGGFHGPVQTQQGSGQDDGAYTYSSTLETRKDFSYKGSSPRALLGHFHVANLVQLQAANQPSDELVWILNPEDRKANSLPFVSYYLNRGDADFDNTPVTVDVHQECASGDVRWGDVNGDGLDDFICLDANGIPHVSINRAGNPPKFESIGAIRDVKTAPSKVRLADIDGDGRLDFCTVEVNGVYCWRNAGTGDAPTAKYTGHWEDILMEGGGTTLDLPHGLDPAGTRLIDINGDGRADWLYVHNDTHVDIRINQRGDRSDGQGLKPHWANATNDIEGWPKDPSITPNDILFGRVFGSGRIDVVRMEKIGKDFDYEFHFYRNTGRGGIQLRGDGVRYCDMFGRGHDDYLWIGPDGSIDLFENIQKPPLWAAHDRILDTKHDHKFLHVGDWDGDGLCDILTVDHLTGNVDMWRNTYEAGKTMPTFEAPMRVVNSDLCPQPIVNGNLFDLAVRFGDLDGDKRVDYICMFPDGRSLGWLNTPHGLQTMPSMNPHQIKIAEGFERADMRWADVNGDGRVDLLAINSTTSTLTLYINLATTPSLTSGISWFKQTSLFPPKIERSANVHFPRLSKSKRADYHVVDPRTAEAQTWYNQGECVGARDDGVVTDPGLPGLPGS